MADGSHFDSGALARSAPTTVARGPDISRLQTAAQRDTLRCLFFNGATWAGNIPSKAGRADLIEWGWAAYHDGWTYLTPAGVEACVAAGLVKELERRAT